MSYPSDLSDAEWALIKPYFAPKTTRGSAFKHDKKQVVNAILYVLKGGITWRMMPNDCPPWQTVYDHFSRWNKQGVWEKALDAINKRHRKKVGKKSGPSYGIIDAQSVKTQAASEDRGIDGGKKVKGHKRHILVDTQGHLLHVKVHAANQSDTKAAGDLLLRSVEKYPTLAAFSGDAGYRGTAVSVAKDKLNRILYISTKIKDGWAVLPKRWVVERTFAWLNNFRRLSKDFEILTATSENFIRLAMLKLTVAKCI